jgi:glucokinase
MIGIDVGGTKSLGVLVDGGGKIRHMTRRPTRRDAEGLVLVVAELVSELEAAAGEIADPLTVGVGLPALIDRDGRMHATPHLADPRGSRPLDVRDLLEARLQRPVVVDNDATMATYAEWKLGAGRGVSSMIMITLGTGIGGGAIVDGRLLRGEHGFAGEFGHMMIDPDGPPCACGRNGCWERYASGQGLRLLAQRAAAEGTLARVLDDADGDVEAVTGEAVEAAARDGDVEAQAVLEVFADWLGIGLSNLTNAFDPAAFVLGGGLASSEDVLGGPIRRRFAEHLYASARRPQPDVRFAELGVAAGALGAAIRGALR